MAKARMQSKGTIVCWSVIASIVVQSIGIWLVQEPCWSQATYLCRLWWYRSTHAIWQHAISTCTCGACSLLSNDSEAQAAFLLILYKSCLWHLEWISGHRYHPSLGSPADPACSISLTPQRCLRSRKRWAEMTLLYLAPPLSLACAYFWAVSHYLSAECIAVIAWTSECCHMCFYIAALTR